MSGDINVDDDEEEVEFPESGEWFGRAVDDKFCIPLQDIPFPIIEAGMLDPPFC